MEVVPVYGSVRSCVGAKYETGEGWGTWFSPGSDLLVFVLRQTSS